LQFQTFDRRPYLERLRSGDFRTQEHFVAYFSELIHLKLRVRLHSPQDIEDVRQETFARVCNRHAVGGERCFYSATDGRFYSELKKGAISRRCPAPGETFPAPLGRCLPKAFLLGSVSDVHRFLNHYKEILLFRNVKPERLDQIEHPKASFCI